eukprot:361235-Chlamydomonas_euryale.AAC.2
MGLDHLENMTITRKVRRGAATEGTLAWALRPRDAHSVPWHRAASAAATAAKAAGAAAEAATVAAAAFCATAFNLALAMASFRRLLQQATAALSAFEEGARADGAENCQSCKPVGDATAAKPRLTSTSVSGSVFTLWIASRFDLMLSGQSQPLGRTGLLVVA